MMTPLTPRQEKSVLFTTAIVSGMGVADMMAVNTALPVIQRQLGMEAASALWVAEVYMLFVASLMMMGGALGDRFGRRRVLRYGIVAFAATSMLCALSPSSGMLIFARAAQGVAAALAMPSSLALLNACFPPARRGQAVGSWAAVSSLMIPLGPLVGGAAVDLLSWHWIFLINLPLCAIAYVLLRGVPKPPYDPPLGAALDVPGVVAVTTGLGALVFGLLEGSRRGFGDELVIASLVAAAVLLPLTLLIEAKSPHPMLPLWMFRRRVFMMINLQTFLFFAGFQGVMFILPFFLIQVSGYSALQAGAVGLPIAAAIALMSRPAGRFMDFFSPRPLLASAPFVVTAGIYLLAQVPVESDFIRHVLPAILFLALGLGLYVTPVTAVAMNAAGEGRSGMASGVNNTVARIAGLISIALTGLVLTSVFSRQLLGGIPSLGLDAAQTAAVARRVQHIGTLIPPEGLNDAQTQAFVNLVHQAFAGGFHTAMLFAAVFVFLAGLIGLLMLLNIAPVPDE